MDSLLFFLPALAINPKWSMAMTLHMPLKTREHAEHHIYPISLNITLSHVFNLFPFLNLYSLFLFQTEESPYINGRYYSKIIISPEENVTLTCTAENQLERTVNSLNVSASEYFISGIKKVRKFEVILH